MAPDHAIFLNDRLWKPFAKELGDRSLRVWRIECGNSYASDEKCGPEMLTALESYEYDEPTTMPHKYIIWGYSKGGNTSLIALANSKELREKTLALISWLPARRWRCCPRTWVFGNNAYRNDYERVGFDLEVSAPW